MKELKFCGKCLKVFLIFKILSINRNNTNIPIIASGGMGTSKDIVDLVAQANIQAVAFADIIHYNRSSILEIKNFYNKK